MIYNASDSFFIAQNDEFYYLSDNGITAVSKRDGSMYKLLRDPFRTNSESDCIMALYGSDLYYYDINSVPSEMEIHKLSLNTMISEKIFSKNANGSSGFLGTVMSGGSSAYEMIYDFFTDGETLYFMFHEKDGVYRLKNGRFECIIPDRIYNSQLSFNGQTIFYIDSALDLKCCNVYSSEIATVETSFANAIYYDGSRILFSDRNGIFSLNADTFQTTLISNFTADKISSDGEHIVFSKGNTLYLLCEDPLQLGKFENIRTFSVISGSAKVIVKYFTNNDFKIEVLDFAA
ncbi:MAG: hypothetical protein NC299_14845 [Lachnospiraceae bacterium]|nr:hypothetical protein [Ruminococcus sp.]MCM1276614.1 hypothetical protein [Lachnospiraceae bacterium]